MVTLVKGERYGGGQQAERMSRLQYAAVGKTLYDRYRKGTLL